MITTLRAEDCLHSQSRDKVSKEPDYRPNELEVDVTTLKFNDEGDLVNKEDLTEILDHIKARREDNSGGVIQTILVFVIY